ncbi:cache domain-containing protein [Vibrio sp. MA40-2]|uniref:bifunctional diguanylate cyclase/phosphodiesterase n=1 Tax=Vibrio sp. MA40-2 TaxID=3391828 RepID=UPI0039A6B805
MPLINDTKLLRLIRYAPVVFIVLFIMCINVVIIQDNRVKAKKSIQSLRYEVIERQKNIIRQHVELVANEINYQSTKTREILRRQAKQRVNEAYAIANNLYLNNQDKSKDEIIKLISDALRPIRFFEGRGYYFIFQMDGVSVMHGLKPEIEGKSAWNAKDTRGTYILQQHIQLIKQDSEAFYRWWYRKPDEPKTEEFEKIGFGKLFEPYNWMIGTGEYVVDVEHDVQAEIIDWVTDYGYEDKGFIFLLDGDGTVLSHREPNFVGTNIADSKLITQLNRKNMMLKAAQGGGFVSYKIPAIYPDANQGTENKQREKISFVQGIDGWDWVIGTGFYLDDFEEYLAEKQALLREQNQQEFIKMLTLSSILTALTVALSLVLNNMIANRFNNFQLRINADFRELENTKNKMQHMATHDALTGLPNRLLLIDEISQGIEYAQKNGFELAVVFVDLDDFKKVNDLYGHASGDKLLEIVSRKFETILGPKDTISRFGGDEFIFCFPQLSGMEQARDKLNSISRVFDDPFVINGKVLVTNCSIGVSMFPSDSDNAESLIRKADIVLYKSKAIQKGKVMFYDDSINEQIQYEYRLEEELRDAVAKEEIFVLYQPQIEVESGQLVGVEALARWSSGRFGVISPVKFIEVSERIGVINQIGQFVFRRACEDILSISPNGQNAIDLSINISPKQLMEPGFSVSLVEIVNDVGIAIERLTLEITENILINDVNKVSPILHALRDLGFGISLDDFGTGYSSLSYLNNLPISEIKIDRCFIDKVIQSPQSVSLIKAIIAIGRSCEMKVVAEGVESEEQYNKLVDLGCSLVQGYYFDKPLSIEELILREEGKVSA